MQIVISNHSKKPIYEQIHMQIRNLILTGELKEGEALPSMRQLAKDLEISLITTKRAYEELEKSKLIYSIIGKGSFVSEQNKELLRERKQKVIEEKLTEAIQNGLDLQITLSEMQELMRILYREEQKNG
jgi:GntR family transcriptional regulator